MPVHPRPPQHLDPLAGEILDHLQRNPGAEEIVLGGYFALRQYLDYRATHDLDAWWRTGRTEKAMQAIRLAMEAVAARHGLEVRERSWGETVSFELVRAAKTVFSFQVAVRSVELDPPVESRWPPILIESLHDNIGSKMNALVQRGAARDFLDIRQAVIRKLVTAEECWELWARKNPGGERAAAMANVLKHLEALEQRRPLEDIRDAGERTAARETRQWVREELLRIQEAQEG